MESVWSPILRILPGYYHCPSACEIQSLPSRLMTMVLLTLDWWTCLHLRSSDPFFDLSLSLALVPLEGCLILKQGKCLSECSQCFVASVNLLSAQIGFSHGKQNSSVFQKVHASVVNCTVLGPVVSDFICRLRSSKYL